MSAPVRIPPLSSFEESPLRRQLIERLRQSQLHEIVTYTELSAVINCDVQRGCRHLLDSAQKALLRERIAFGPVINLGLKRLDDVGIVGRAETGATRIHRAARRAGRILTLAEFDRLPLEDQKRYRVTEIRLGVAAQFGGRAVGASLTRAIEASVTPKQLKAAIVESLEQF